MNPSLGVPLWVPLWVPFGVPHGVALESPLKSPFGKPLGVPLGVSLEALESSLMSPLQSPFAYWVRAILGLLLRQRGKTSLFQSIVLLLYSCVHSREKQPLGCSDSRIDNLQVPNKPIFYWSGWRFSVTFSPAWTVSYSFSSSWEISGPASVSNLPLPLMATSSALLLLSKFKVKF